MTNRELAESVLKTINLFYFLQELDERFEDENHHAESVVNGYFRKRYGIPAKEIEGVLPLLQAKTGLSLLLITFAYGAQRRDEEWERVGMTIKASYDIEFTSSSGESATLRALIRAVWMACQNIAVPDTGLTFYPAVAFDTGVMVFTTPEAQIKFRTAPGYVHFLSDYLRALRHLCGSEISQADS